MKVLCEVLLLVGVLVCCGAQLKKCPEAELSVQKFNMTEFLKVPSWNEVKTLNGLYVASSAGCISVKYSKFNETTDKDLIAEYTFYESKKSKNQKYSLKQLTGKGYENGDIFTITPLENGTAIGDNLKYQILATDYKSFTVIYGCEPNKTNPDAVIQRVSVLSNATTLDRKQEGAIELALRHRLELPKFEDAVWANVQQNKTVCSSASIFAVSTVLSSVVAMLLFLTN